MIEIARFADVYEAEIAAARLRTDGFEATLGGAEHAKADPLILQALGWVRLSVPDEQAVSARAILDRLRSGAEAIEERAEPEPATRADRTLPAKITLGGVLLALLFGS